MAVQTGRHGHTSLWGPRGSHAALFAPSVDARRIRRSTDAILLVLSAVALWLLAMIALPTSGFEKALIGLISEVPSFLAILWRLGNGLLLLWIVTLVVATLVRRRFAVALDIVCSLVVAAAVGILIAHKLNGKWPSLSQIFTGGSASLVPAVSLGAAIAVTAIVAPQLSRSFRSTGWVIAVYATFSTVLLQSTSPIGAAIAFSIGILSAAAVHLALGTEAGHPGHDEILGALDELGVPVDELADDHPPTAGVYTLRGTMTDHRPFIVRVYGRDAWDTQILAKLWRSLVYRDSSAPTLTRLQQVEHEAFVTLMAASRGVRVPEVVAAGRTASGDALFVLTDAGSALPEPPPAPAKADVPVTQSANDGSWMTDPSPVDLTAPVVDVELVPTLPDVEPDAEADTRLGELWALVRSLHSIGLVLGDVEMASFSIAADGSLQFADLHTAVAAPSDDQIHTDLSQLLMVTAVLYGPERAVVAASGVLGPDGLAGMLAYLQPAALTRPMRHAVKKSATDVDEVRTLAAAAAGVEAPKIAKLRRVSTATLMRVGLLALIAFAVITAISGISLSQLKSELSGAQWGWVVAAIVVGQLPFFTQAVAARGACPRRIAYGPLAVLQFAIGFINLAIPSSAARIALDVRFFQRQGVPAAAAVSIAAIDGFSGFLVQIALLIATLVFGLGAVDLTFDPPKSSGGSNDLALVVGICLALFVLAVVLAVAVPKIRNRIVSRVKPLLGQVRDTVRSLRSPAKLAQLFGGCLANQILFAMTLGACVWAFGGHLNLATLIVVYVAAALFGGMMPVPGGIGVMVAALIAGLVAAGVPSTTATAAAITFRLVTFYLPPIWGWVAFSWLQRKSYL